MITPKPPIQLTPRYVWLIQRTSDCIACLDKFRDQTSWEQYMTRAKEMAKEILYCTTEWEKYYKDSESNQ